MRDYAEVCKDCGKFTNDLIQKMNNVGNVYKKDVPAISTALTEFLLPKLIKSKLSNEIISSIINESSTHTEDELYNMNKLGVVYKDDVPKLYIKIFKKHFVQLFSTKNKDSLTPIPTKPKSRENFVELNHPEYFYQKLELEINICYSSEAYTAVLILSRKLIENLLIDVLRKKYGYGTKRDVEMYYSTEKGRFHDFAILLRQIEEQKKDFDMDGDILEQFLKLVQPFRRNANRKAHSVVNLIDKKKELKEFDVQKMASLMIRLYNNA